MDLVQENNFGLQICWI